MYHTQRWTADKVKQRLELITPLVYIKRKGLPSFRFCELDDASWPEIHAHEYRGSWMQHFVLRTTPNCDVAGEAEIR